MKAYIQTIRTFIKDTTGQDLAEYGIALAVIGAGAALAAVAIAGQVEILWDTASTIITIAAN
jgi:Flp pilus assembly pilin Flp